MRDLNEEFWFEKGEKAYCISHEGTEEFEGIVTEDNFYKVLAFNPDTDEIKIYDDYNDVIWIGCEFFYNEEEYFEVYGEDVD